MKKLLLLFLIVALTLSCFISCSYFGGGSSNGEDIKTLFFISPEDEESTVYTVTQTDENGLKLEITLHGYKSESLGKEFYVKNNEYFIADVKLTNESETPVYQFLPTACRDMSPSHNHEISFDIANGDNKLHSSSFGFACPDMIDVWTIEPGQSYEWQLKLAAGAPGSTTTVTYPNADNKEKDDSNPPSEKEAVEENSVSKSYIYYGSDVVQNGNFQVFESTFVGSIGGNFFGSDFTLNQDGVLSTSYHIVMNGSALNIAGFLPADGDTTTQGLLLYGNNIYTDNVCTFEGPISFSYMKSSDGFENMLSVSVPLSIEVVYVSGGVNIIIQK